MSKCVNITWRNGFGNQLFQYALGRLIAKENNLELTYSSELGRACSSSLIHHKFIKETEHIIQYDSNKHMIEYSIDYEGNIIYDSLENPHTYKNYLDEIKSWFTPIVKTNLNDLVVHIRRGDNGDNINTPVDWYLKVMDNIEYDKVFLVTDEPNHKDVKEFLNKTDAKLFSSSTIVTLEDRKNNKNQVINDFNFIRTFDKILFSNSTFAWWASLLSKASQIYFNSDWQLRHHNGKIKLGETDYKNWTGYSEEIIND